ncbi:hypothetical protein [Paraburkholderia sp. BCC1876]|uniref:hypothetical protein n=1 Tax=Paraburkholderia sp. BCC1876 TaxID=2676303 RepID=UPI001FC7D096|nr:hypothetical protein [Paraburkholderia sp. BCC1876]
MVLLAMSAGKVWSSRAPIWAMFGRAYGSGVQRQVALLSAIWMTGVLAAQIHGSAAVLLLTGLPQNVALPVVLVLVFAASRLNLKAASAVFSLCLLASSFVLGFALWKMGGATVYFDAAPRFLSDVHAVSYRELAAMAIAVVFLVVTGADYQQFVIAARRKVDAWIGCGLAAIILLLVGALPASAVIIARNTGLLAGMTNANQAIPVILSHVSSQVGRGWGAAMLLALLGAALGSGAAIVRAMSSALQTVVPATTGARGVCLSAGIVLLGGLVAQRGQGIIDTMVELNVVYIASVAPLFVFLLSGLSVPRVVAQRAIAAGFAMSLLLYLGKWLGFASGQVELSFLSAGAFASFMVLALSRRTTASTV